MHYKLPVVFASLAIGAASYLAPSEARADSVVTEYRTVVEQSDAPDCLVVSGFPASYEPLILVENTCDVAVRLEVLECSTCEHSPVEIATGARGVVDAVFHNQPDTPGEVSWSMAGEEGTIAIHVSPDSGGSGCAISSGSTNAPLTSVFAFLMVITPAIRRRKRR